MCSKIDARASTYVNLVLNPERDTGYNGSSVWKVSKYTKNYPKHH